jgi:hypothetical protein
MGKRPVPERWRDYLFDEYRRFRNDPEWSRLQARGLAVLGRSEQVTSQELWEYTSNLGSEGSEWMAFIRDSKEVASRFGLTANTVVDSCLVKAYRPERQHFSIGLRGIEIAVDTPAAYGSPFFRNLYAHASDLGLTVISGQARIVPSRQGVVLHGDGGVTTIPWSPITELSLEELPPLATAFKMRVETLPGVPHEMVAEAAREAAQAGDELARRLGYHVPHRRRRRSVAQGD